MLSRRALFIFGISFVFGGAPVFSEHEATPTKRPKVPSRTSQCSKTRFEQIFGLNSLETELKSNTSQKTSRPLVPAESITEKRYGGGGLGATWAYDVVTAWRYKAPDDRIFRLAVSDSLSCLSEGQEESSNALSSLLNQDGIFNKVQPNGGKLKRDEAARPEDLLAYRKMRELFENLKTVMAKHKGKKEFAAFFQAFFKQIQKNEESLLSKEPKLELHPDLLKEIEKLRKEGSDELLSFVTAFSKTPEFDYWLHPILANYFRKALGDPAFSLKPSAGMTTAQAQDLGREFQKILQGTSTPADVKGPSLIDPLTTQGRVSSGEVVTPAIPDLLKADLEKLAGRLRNPDGRKTSATLQETAQLLSRALNDHATESGKNPTPEFLALKDAARNALAVLSQDGSSPAPSSATELEGEDSRRRNETDRLVLDPLRQKLEAELSGHKYPVSLKAIDTVSAYPDSLKELIQSITRRLEPTNLSRSAQTSLEDFLQTGETQHLFDLLFKNRGAFEGALGFLRSAKEASKGDQALLRATSLLSQLGDKSFKPSGNWAEEYPYTRRLLKDSIDRLSQDPSRAKDRDAHLLALRLLDEMGLEGVTDRDTKDSNSYRPEELYQELKAEQTALLEACGDSADPKDCIQKLERSLMDRAHAFVGKPSGLTSEIRRNLVEHFPSESDLRRYDHLEKGSPLRQAALLSGRFNPEDIKNNQSTEIPLNERNQRVFGASEESADAETVAKHLPKLFGYRREAAKESASLAEKLSGVFSTAATELTEGNPEEIAQIKSFYRCLSLRLAEQASGYNNSLAIRALALWASSPSAPGESARLKIAANQLECPLPEDLEEVFSPPAARSQQAEQALREQASRLSTTNESEKKVHSSRLAEQGLIELEHLRRLEIDIQREQALFGSANNPIIQDLQTKRKASIKDLEDLGLAGVLDDPEVKKLLSPNRESSPLTKKDLERLERDYKLHYDSETNSFLITPETRIDENLLNTLSRVQGIHLRYRGPEQTEEVFLLNGGNSKSLLSLMAQQASEFGVSSLDTPSSWGEIHKLDAANPDGKPLPKWFPFTSSTSARLIEKNGVLSADFSSTEKLGEDARKKMQALIQSRTAAHTAASQYGELGHAAKSYFGAVLGYNPEKSSESQELQNSYNRYAELRSAFGAIGIVPIGGTQMTTDQFNKNEIHMMKDYLHREEESIHQFLTNVETIHQISEMALTAAMPLGPLVALEGKLAQIAAGSGKVAFAARQALRATRLAIQLRNTTRSGLGTAAKFEGVSLVADSALSLLPDSTNAIVEERIKRAKDGRMGDDWRQHSENPAFDSKWGTLDPKTGQPTDPKLRKEFLQAMLEFNIEESMDVDGDGIIDELQGEGGTPVPFAKKRTFLSSLTDPHRFQGFADSAAFFRNLGLAKALPVPRWITLPTEMALAGAIQEASRSQESLRWEAKQTGKEPGSLLERVGHSLSGGFVEGGRFGLSGSVSNAALTQMVGGKRSGFNTLLGAALFVGVDSATKAAINQAQYGHTGFERGSWEEFGKDFIKDNAVTFYIGMDIARSGLERKNHRDLKAAYLEGGELALRKALEGQGKPVDSQDQYVQTILSSVNPQEFAASSPSVQRAHLELLESRLKEGNQRFEEAQKAAFRAGQEVITPEEARRVGQINRELVQLFREGSWNRTQEIAKLLGEQDRIFARVTKALEQGQKDLQTEEARLAADAASADPSVQLEFERKSRKLQAQYEMVNNLTEAATRMAPLRVLAEPVETIAALTDPRSQIAEKHFEDRPAALAALKRYQKSVGQTAWDTLTRFGGWMADEHVAPDLRRSDSGQGGVKELAFGGRPSNSGITGREQRAAAEFVERVFRDKKTSLSEKRELLGIILQLDPVKADALARRLTSGEKTK